MFLRRKSDTDDLVGVYAGVARTSRRGSRKGRRSSTKEVSNSSKYIRSNILLVVENKDILEEHIS